MKEISKDQRSFLTKEIENNAKKIIERIIEKMNPKSDKLSTRIKIIDRQAEPAESLAKQLYLESEVPGSNPIKGLAGLSNPTSLRGSR